MNEPATIRILENDANRCGDLFGRLMADLFIALGYDRPRMNIHKSGRELDLAADHRLEPRRAIGECKATAETAGGGDLNKFVGALDVEADDDDDKRPLTGYFISLAGFKETAVEQEKQRKRTKIVMLTGSQVIDELVNGRIIISRDKATDLAGRCCAGIADLALDPRAELLAHKRGWVWAVYYTKGKARTHTALIHSDGTPLAREIADEVIASDRSCGGDMHRLACLNPKPSSYSDAEEHVPEALEAYRQYITSECGDIQLDGLPADSDVGSRRLRLENLFVPLHLDVAPNEAADTSGELGIVRRQPVGSVLADCPRLALLAAPGGGKSTLIKRLAVAYVDPSRREQIGDDLPSRDWLPLFIRCRELRHLARGSFAELLDALSQREPVRQYAKTFRAYVDRALLEGRILLLVDGLDEISDPGDRAAFVCTVRTALQAYPGIGTIVTSREAGFRHVAAHLAAVCTQAVISPFNPDDIRRLSVAWHREVLGDTEKVRVDAEHLAITILQSDRILRLAVNPLLLTTLLLVKRWVGSLPTRRTVLYGKAVEVLLMTWNVEGHEPIPEDEALPQLCFIASAMMLSGSQKISRPRLAALIQDARSALPTELGYVRGTVDQFIQRIEDRSSLLMMSGLDIEDGKLVEFFEFRHLTFQEFLTARAMVEGWHPGRTEMETLVDVLEPHIDAEPWREVIPLAAALGGKATEALIQRLTGKLAEIQDQTETHSQVSNQVFHVLESCLADEVQARPDTIRGALYEIVRLSETIGLFAISPTLVRSRYGPDLQGEAQKQFLNPESSENLQGQVALYEVVWSQTVDGDSVADYRSATEVFLSLLNEPGVLPRCKGALGIAHLCASLQPATGAFEFRDLLQQARPRLVQMILGEESHEQYTACWALGLLGSISLAEDPLESRVFWRLFALWRHASSMSVRLAAVFCLIRQPVAARSSKGSAPTASVGEVRALVRDYAGLDSWQEKPVVLLCAWFTRAVSDARIATLAGELSAVDSMVYGGTPYKKAIDGLLSLLRDEGALPRSNPD